MDKRYLGDSVYADWGGTMLLLTTENGYGPSNSIYLEPAVVDAFLRYWEDVVREIEGESDEGA